MIAQNLIRVKFQCQACFAWHKALVKRSSAGKDVFTDCKECNTALKLNMPKTFKKDLMARNAKRNAPMGEARECKHCKFSWPAETHLGRFESYQSRCLTGKMYCINVKPRKTAA